MIACLFYYLCYYVWYKWWRRNRYLFSHKTFFILWNMEILFPRHCNNIISRDTFVDFFPTHIHIHTLYEIALYSGKTTIHVEYNLRLNAKFVEFKKYMESFTWVTTHKMCGGSGKKWRKSSYAQSNLLCTNTHREHTQPHSVTLSLYCSPLHTHTRIELWNILFVQRKKLFKLYSAVERIKFENFILCIFYSRKFHALV